MIVSFIFIFALKVYFYMEQLTKTPPGVLRWSWFRNLRERIQRSRDPPVMITGSFPPIRHRLRRRVVLPIWAGKRMFLSAPSPSVIGNWVGVTGLLLPGRVRAGLGLPVEQEGGRPCTARRPSLGGVGLLILQTSGDIEAHDSLRAERKEKQTLPIPSASPVPWLPNRPRCDRSSPRTSSSSSSFSLTRRRRGRLPLPLSDGKSRDDINSTVASHNPGFRHHHGSDLYVKNSLYILNLLVISNRRAFSAKSFPRIIDSCR